MSLKSLFNQTLTFYAKSSYNSYGREIVGSAVSVKGRFQETTKRVLLPNGNLLTIDGIVYVPADTTVNTDDRMDYGGNKFKVYGKYSAVDGKGDTNHIKLHVVKWKET